MLLQKIQITRGSRNLSNARGTLIRRKRRRISCWSGCALESKESDVHAVGFTKEINAEMLVDNKKVNFQIDCGASINIIPAKHAQGHEIKSTTKTLRMWNGSNNSNPSARHESSCAIPKQERSILWNLLSSRVI